MLRWSKSKIQKWKSANKLHSLLTAVPHQIRVKCKIARISSCQYRFTLVARCIQGWIPSLINRTKRTLFWFYEPKSTEDFDIPCDRSHCDIRHFCVPVCTVHPLSWHCLSFLYLQITVLMLIGSASISVASSNVYSFFKRNSHFPLFRLSGSLFQTNASLTIAQKCN